MDSELPEPIGFTLRSNTGKRRSVMTRGQIDELRKAVDAYRQDRDDFHLLNWIRQAETLRLWRRTGFGGPGTFIHFLPRQETTG
jgi:hypothetical protein